MQLSKHNNSNLQYTKIRKCEVTNGSPAAMNRNRPLSKVMPYTSVDRLP